MTLETLKTRHAEFKAARDNAEAAMNFHLAEAEKAKLNKLANDGAMQGVAILMAEEEANLAALAKLAEVANQKPLASPIPDTATPEAPPSESQTEPKSNPE